MSGPKQPAPWATYSTPAKHRLARVWYRFQWICEWAVWWASQWAFIKVLEYIGKLTLLGALITYFVGCNERKRIAADQLRTRQYAAWQVISAASGKGGDGGRALALQDLNRAGVSLSRVDLSHAVLDNIILTNAALVEANLMGAVLNGAHVTDANCYKAEMYLANLWECNFDRTKLELATFTLYQAYFCRFAGCNLSGASVSGRFTMCDLSGANLFKANLAGAQFEAVNFAGANFEDVQNWRDIRSLVGCNLFGVKNPPAGFLDWASDKGVFVTNITDFAAWQRFHRK